jgi:hypothetical protein
LPYRASDNLPFGTAWNTGKNYTAGKSCSQWATGLAGIWLSSSIELPYASVGQTTVTPETARAFGADLARALRQYVQRRTAERSSTQ